MYRIIAIFAVLFALAGCVVTPPASNTSINYTPPPPVDEPVVDTGFDPDFDATYSSDSGIDTSAPVDVVAPISPAAARPPEGAMLDQQRAACTREGGRFVPRGTGFYACVFQTGDSGRQCDEASDCEGSCLARSRTCAPMQPLFGCHDVFTLAGRRETVCTD